MQGIMGDGYITSPGIASLLYDHPCFGTSSGKPRQGVDLQRSDVHDAVSHLLSLLDADPDKIGIIGFSYSAAHAVKAASLDRRIKAVVSINSVIRGSRLLGLMISDRTSADALIWEDSERRRTGGGEIGYLPIYKTVGTPENIAFSPTDEVAEYYLEMQRAEIADGGEWRNGDAIQSLLNIREYNIVEGMKVLTPENLLIIVDKDSVRRGEDWKAFEATGEGGEIVGEFVTIEGGHFDSLTEGRGLEKVN
ncbi:unnamed protein product [Tuber aestivum]|uniref:Xaa-Pro dipeptidyl-peptidase-like domain-containing protein n=1 Tax=Tuber aestivum TaxID=59557 RepID=A0A292PT90_9PEZI|nr:unnamed protein product [Tuber aestivum]